MSKATETKMTTEDIASKSACSLHNAMNYLNVALSELAEAKARTEDRDDVDGEREQELFDHLTAALDASGGFGITKIKELRDRRSARAGFSFGE